MDWAQLREEFDKGNVLEWIRHLPDQCIEAVYYAKKFRPKKRQIENIVACGMGGSGVGAAILRNLLKKELKVPFEVFNSYELPAYVGTETVLLCVSFSGDTEEALACFSEAKKKGAYIVSITTGGKLSKIAKQSLLAMPKGSPCPRMGIAYVCLPLLIVLEKLGMVEKKNSELGEAVFLLKKEQLHLEEKAKELAMKMKNRLPIIYAPEELQAIAYRFRTEINENAKQFALNHFLPEQNHNEISVAFGTTRKKSEIFLLRWQGEHKRVAKRFGIVKKIMGRHFDITEVNLKGKSLMATTFYAIYLAALTSYYLALLNKVDPKEIPEIGRLKKELKK